MAQLVERDLAKVEAAGSSPVSRSRKRNGSSGRMGFFVSKGSQTLENGYKKKSQPLNTK